MATRTATLGVANVTSTLQTTIATVPAGETWILKSALLNNFAVAAVGIQFWVHSSSLNINVLLFNGSLASNAVLTLSEWVVASPGDSFACILDGQPVRFWLSGTRLVGVA